jgi:hypothetical protein
MITQSRLKTCTQKIEDAEKGAHHNSLPVLDTNMKHMTGVESTSICTFCFEDRAIVGKWVNQTGDPIQLKTR